MEKNDTSLAHTSGPWNTYDYDDPKYPWIIIEADVGNHIAYVERLFSKEQRSRAAANARLLAAAPDLLDLVRKLTIVCHDRLADLNEEAATLLKADSEDEDLNERIDHYISLKGEAENTISLIEG